MTGFTTSNGFTCSRHGKAMPLCSQCEDEARAEVERLTAERDDAVMVARLMVKAWDANDPEAQCDAIAAIEVMLRAHEEQDT